jgi:hypothetical protein
MFGSGPAGTYASPDSGINIPTREGLTLTNEYEVAVTDEQFIGTPVVADGTVFVASGGKFYAFDETATTNCTAAAVTDCQPLWTANVGGASAVANGVAFVLGGSAVYAFDAAGRSNCAGSSKTCSPMWRVPAPTGDGFAGVPRVSRGVLYVGSNSGNLFAFDAAGGTNCSGTPKTCSPLWRTTTGGSPVYGAAVANGVAYIGGDKLYAFDAAGKTNCGGTPRTCAPLWTGDDTSTNAFATPAISSGIVYAGIGGHTDTFDATGRTNCTGSPAACAPLWQTSGPGGVTVANGVLYGYESHTIYAYDATGNSNCTGTPKTCGPLWTADTGSSGDFIWAPPAVANGILYVGVETNVLLDRNELLAYDAAGNTNCSGVPKTCTPIWSGLTNHALPRMFNGPVVANGTVYLGAGFTLYAFKFSMGTLLEAYKPVMRYERDHYFATSPAVMTDNYTCCYTNTLKTNFGTTSNVTIASSDPNGPGSTLNLDFLRDQYAQPVPDGTGRTVAREDDFLDAHDGTTQVDSDALFSRYGHRIYGRGTFKNGYVYLQYWFFYYYNPGIAGFGAHEGDWEMIQLRFDPNASGTSGPDEVTYAQHGGGERCTWRDVEKQDGRPVVYVGQTSGASYFHTALSDPQQPPDPQVESLQDFVSRTDGVGSNTTPRWLGWPGHWGASAASGVAQTNSPQGPAYGGNQSKWNDPANFASSANSCGDEVEPH